MYTHESMCVHGAHVHEGCVYADVCMMSVCVTGMPKCRCWHTSVQVHAGCMRRCVCAHECAHVLYWVCTCACTHVCMCMKGCVQMCVHAQVFMTSVHVCRCTGTHERVQVHAQCEYM